LRAAQLFRDSKAIPTRAEREEIKIGGIIRSIRKQKHASFAHISDGSTLAPIQVVLNPELAVGYVIRVLKEFIEVLILL
jgi:asparaginyl-tRNA synthetase